MLYICSALLCKRSISNSNRVNERKAICLYFSCWLAFRLLSLEAQLDEKRLCSCLVLSLLLSLVTLHTKCSVSQSLVVVNLLSSGCVVLIKWEEKRWQEGRKGFQPWHKVDWLVDWLVGVSPVSKW